MYCFPYPTLYLMPPLGGTRRNLWIKLIPQKLEGYRTLKSGRHTRSLNNTPGED